MKTSVNKILAGALATSLASVVVLSVVLIDTNRELKKVEARRDLRLTYEKQRSGSLQMGPDYVENGGFLNFDLRSFDGGQVWYAVENQPGSGFKILGEADAVYPGLRKSLAALDKLEALAYALKGQERPYPPPQPVYQKSGS